MGELQHAVTPPERVRSAARRRRPGPSRAGPLAILASFALVVATLSGCGPVAPTGPAASSGPPAPTSSQPSQPTAIAEVSPSPAAIDPGLGRLVWLTDRAGALGVWTTDLAGGDVRTYAAGVDEIGTSLREPRPVGQEVVIIRDGPTAELWILSATAPPRLLLDAVETYTVNGDQEILAVRDQGKMRTIWRVPLTGAAPSAVAGLPIAADAPDLGPFGFAISPDGRTVAAGWVGGPVHVSGPVPATFRDIGAPLVVADDGRIVAVTGRVGDAYLLDGDRLVDLAPPESDPVAVPGSGVVAWASIAEDRAVRAVELRDLLAGTSETYPAEGLATNVVDLSAGHVILEATAFDPLTRTVGVVDRQTGRFGTFEASAPPAD